MYRCGKQATTNCGCSCEVVGLSNIPSAQHQLHEEGMKMKIKEEELQDEEPLVFYQLPPPLQPTETTTTGTPTCTGSMKRKEQARPQALLPLIVCNGEGRPAAPGVSSNPHLAHPSVRRPTLLIDTSDKDGDEQTPAQSDKAGDEQTPAQSDTSSSISDEDEDEGISLPVDNGMIHSPLSSPFMSRTDAVQLLRRLDAHSTTGSVATTNRKQSVTLISTTTGCETFCSTNGPTESNISISCTEPSKKSNSTAGGAEHSNDDDDEDEEKEEEEGEAFSSPPPSPPQCGFSDLYPLRCGDGGELVFTPLSPGKLYDRRTTATGEDISAPHSRVSPGTSTSILGLGSPTTPSTPLLLPQNSISDRPRFSSPRERVESRSFLRRVEGPLYVKYGLVYILCDCSMSGSCFTAIPRAPGRAAVRFQLLQLEDVKLLDHQHYHDRFMFEVILEGEAQQKLNGSGFLQDDISTAISAGRYLDRSLSETSFQRSETGSRSRSRKFASLPKRVDGASGGSLNPCGLHSIAPDQGHAGGEGFSVLTFKAVGFNDLSHWVDELRTASSSEDSLPSSTLPSRLILRPLVEAAVELPVFGLQQYRFGRVCI